MNGEVTATNRRIRLADPNEASTIAAVLLESFIEYRALYTDQGFAATTPKREQVHDRLKEGPLWVVISEGEVVGTASGVLKNESLYVRGMAVLPVARGKRVGELLLEEIERYATLHNCKWLLLSTTPFLDRAIRLYERFGFQRTCEGPHDLFGTPLFTMKKLVRSGQARDLR